MKLDKARELAEYWIGYLYPACEFIKVAGSIRREKPEVKDIEIVAIPRIGKNYDLFGNVVFGETTELNYLLRNYDLGKNGPRYKQIKLKEINIDLFLVLPPAQWGVIFTIRTGPAAFSRRIVTPKYKGGYLPNVMKVEKGALWRIEDETPFKIPIETEFDFFKAIGLNWIDPAERE